MVYLQDNSLTSWMRHRKRKINTLECPYFGLLLLPDMVPVRKIMSLLTSFYPWIPGSRATNKFCQWSYFFELIFSQSIHPTHRMSVGKALCSPKQSLLSLLWPLACSLSVTLLLLVTTLVLSSVNINKGQQSTPYVAINPPNNQMS